jgi:hypothetical protein
MEHDLHIRTEHAAQHLNDWMHRIYQIGTFHLDGVAYLLAALSSG